MVQLQTNYMTHVQYQRETTIDVFELVAFCSQKQLLFDSCPHRWRQLPHSSIHNTRSTLIGRRWRLMLRWRLSHGDRWRLSLDVRLMERWSARCTARCTARSTLDRRVVDGKSKRLRRLQRTRPVRHRLARRSKRRGCRRRHQKRLQRLDETKTATCKNCLLRTCFRNLLICKFTTCTIWCSNVHRFLQRWQKSCESWSNINRIYTSTAFTWNDCQKISHADIRQN